MKENDIKTKAVLVGIVTDRSDAEEVEKSVAATMSKLEAIVAAKEKELMSI